jgi:hypothetical protein
MMAASELGVGKADAEPRSSRRIMSSKLNQGGGHEWT